MLNRIRTFFDDKIQPDETQDREATTRLAAAALLIEVATIDDHFDEKEMLSLKSLLTAKFSLSETDCDELVTMAKDEAKDATSLFQFTQLINTHFSYPDKVSLGEMLWRIAYADGRLDKYEEYMVRKICDLLYLDHADFIRAKLNAQNSRD